MPIDDFRSEVSPASYRTTVGGYWENVSCTIFSTGTQPPTILGECQVLYLKLEGTAGLVLSWHSGRVIKASRSFSVEGISDIVNEGRKFSGSARAG